MYKRWNQWSRILVLLVIIVTTFISSSEPETVLATHYRATQLIWTKVGLDEVEFTANIGVRRSYYGSPDVGSNIDADPIQFGDGSSSDSTFKVIYIDAVNDWLVAEKIVRHTFSETKAYTASIATCCRLSAPLHINNPDASNRVETLVNFGKTSASPVSLISPIIDCRRNAVCTFRVPAIDPDNQSLRFRFATGNEATGGTFIQPGPPYATNIATIDATTGAYVWDTTGASLSTSGDTYYSTQIVIENLDGSEVVSTTAVDFFIRLSDNVSNQPPEFHAPTPEDGTILNFPLGVPILLPVEAHDHDAGDSVTLGMLGKPADATFNTTSGNPAKGVFSWTPTTMGSVILTLTAQDQSGLGATQRSITINVQNAEEECGKSPSTGLDSCLLEPGDILLARSREAGRLVEMIKIGSYFHHAAVYIGGQQIAEAVGVRPNDADEVIITPIKESTWWNLNEKVEDWAVVRPKTTTEKKASAIDRAEDWANASDVRYSLRPFLRKSDTDFYCSQFIWNAFEREGLDLETKKGFFDMYITPEDLFLDSDMELAQIRGVSQRQYPAIFQIFSPAHLMLIDAQGRRTGYDPVTQTILDEIPGALYSGPDADVESISVDDVDGDWQLIVTGFDTGEYHLSADYIVKDDSRSQVVAGQTYEGKVEQFIISDPEDGKSDVVLPNKQSPVLALPEHQSVQYSDSLSFDVSASDPDSQGSALWFKATDLPDGLSLIDHEDGTATVSGTVQASAKTYNVQIAVTDEDGNKDVETIPLAVNKEDVQLTYTGDTRIKKNTPVTLRSVTTNASSTDSTPGDLSKIKILFEVSGGTNTTSKIYGPVTVSANGEASVSIPSGLQPGTYNVAVKLETPNNYYEAPEVKIVSLVVDDFYYIFVPLVHREP